MLASESVFLDVFCFFIMSQVSSAAMRAPPMKLPTAIPAIAGTARPCSDGNVFLDAGAIVGVLVIVLESEGVEGTVPGVDVGWKADSVRAAVAPTVTGGLLKSLAAAAQKIFDSV